MSSISKKEVQMISKISPSFAGPLHLDFGGKRVDFFKSLFIMIGDIVCGFVVVCG